MVKSNRQQSVAVKLRELKHAAPFSPFRIKTAAGETLTVTTADTFMVSPAGRTAILYPKEDRSLHVVELSQVVRIEPTRNGGGKAKRKLHRKGQQ